MKKIVLSVLALLLCASLLFGCNTSKDDQEKDKTEYDAALELIEDGKYAEAYEALLEIEDDDRAKELLTKFKFGYDKIIFTATGEVNGESQTQVQIQEFEYDNRGNPIKETAYYDGELDYVKEFVYDKNGNCVQESEISYWRDSETKYLTQFEYDKNGNKIKETSIDPEELTIESTREYTYEYDEKGNIVKVTESDEYGYSSVQEFFYDSEGMLVKKIDGNYRYEYTYDDNGRVASEKSVYTNRLGEETEEIITTYEYDSKGNQTKLTAEYKDLIGNEVMRAVGEYTYEGENIFFVDAQSDDALNGFNDLEQAKYEKALNYIKNGEHTEAYKIIKALGDYKDCKELLSKFKVYYQAAYVDCPDEYDSSIITLYEGEFGYVEYSYDENGKLLSEIMYYSYGEEIGRYEYTYDNNGVLIKKIYIDRYLVDEYVYDANGNLLKNEWKREDNNTHGIIENEYTYDSDGKIRHVIMIFKNQLGSKDKHIYQYSYNENGYMKTDLSSGDYTEYTLDKNGNVVKIVECWKDGTVYRTTEISYDDQGRIVSQKETRSDRTTLETYKYDDDGYLLRYDITVETSSKKASYYREYSYVDEYAVYVG